MERWCKQWNQPRGEILTLEQQWRLAQAWCGDLLQPDWRRKTAEETDAIFTTIGLTSPFWNLD
ncbi:hypothetical protein GWO43_00400 [candidate division KSB1 bacterium]|nr:hypothetical protein [candidate division KSB1 bacterium]NIR68364.1 hypothetical protein [candidate division KSB1 bacterium]NIS22549.1 hypothetical protein [candidate division KSB1 bacterium]NIT69385.1 hypothetical protein [candidate division KSB1 bacterium]NIU23046.1 hypothetical protein [candidate division KSB1 bacterium]